MRIYKLHLIFVVVSDLCGEERQLIVPLWRRQINCHPSLHNARRQRSEETNNCHISAAGKKYISVKVVQAGGHVDISETLAMTDLLHHSYQHCQQGDSFAPSGETTTHYDNVH